jgi:hypothetical protein
LADPRAPDLWQGVARELIGILTGPVFAPRVAEPLRMRRLIPVLVFLAAVVVVFFGVKLLVPS